MSSNESWLSVSIEPFGKGVADEFTEGKFRYHKNFKEIIAEILYRISLNLI